VTKASAEQTEHADDAEADTLADVSALVSLKRTLQPTEAVRSPLEFARQLTLLEQRMFRAVSRRSMLFYVLNPKKRDHALAQPVRAFITHFNKVGTGRGAPRWVGVPVCWAKAERLAPPARYGERAAQVSDWVASELVREERNAVRWKLLRHFIQLAKVRPCACSLPSPAVRCRR